MSLDEYTGTYSNPGYGSFTLCDPAKSPSLSYCTEVLSDFAAVDSRKPSQANFSLPTQPQLLAKWLRLWSTHLRLVHIPGSESGHEFSVEPTVLFTEGYGADKTPFQIFEAGAPAEFVVENGRVLGLGVFGSVGDLTKSRGNTVQGRSEVWFDKIDNVN
jgi:hypothetical protein